MKEEVDHRGLVVTLYNRYLAEEKARENSYMTKD
jgi:hypothetical protein